MTTQHARPPMSYKALCAQAAADLETALRANASTGRRAYLRAWPSMPLHPGILFVDVEGDPLLPDPYEGRRWPANPPFATIFRPCNGRMWESIPYADLEWFVWDACRSAQIMAPGDPWDERDNLLTA